MRWIRGPGAKVTAGRGRRCARRGHAGAQLLYVNGGQPQRVQLGEFGVGRHPRQFGFQAAEGARQDAHAGAFACVGRIPLHRLVVLGI